MVGAKVLTRGQMARLLQERGAGSKKLEIPGYTIIEKLGKGSMGVVFKARQNSVNRIVAIKILLDSLAQNKEFIRRFEHEAQIAAKLSHNNIVNAIDAGEAGGRFFFVMEYVEGPTIKDYLDKNRVFEEKDAVRIAMAVAEALKHASQRELIHRDVKPENVILTKDGGVKLADLGLARLTGDEAWGLSEAGMAIGTPYYISPEQVRGQTDVDIRADIYGLGATLYHMVTGKVPYSGETPKEVMRKHVDPRVELVPPDHLNTNISSGLGQVIETMMAKNRENRYTTPDDLILDFKCLLQGDAPMIASQRLDSLEALAEGDADEYAASTVDEAQMVEMASYVNARNQIIAALAVVLALSMVTNVLFLVAR
jgi:serine/threonine-protein kinase